MNPCSAQFAKQFHRCGSFMRHLADVKPSTAYPVEGNRYGIAWHGKIDLILLSSFFQGCLERPFL